MALVNPNIALSVRPVELADPMAQYGKIAALQSAQNQNALAQYQLGAAQRSEARDVARTNALAQAGTDETSVANALLKSGDITGYSAFVKAVEDRKTQKLTQDKTQSELLDTKLKQSRSFLDTIDPAAPDAPQRYLAWHEANHRDPIIGAALTARGVSAEQARENIMAAIQKGPAAFAQMLNQSKLGTEKFMEMNKPVTQVIDQSGQRQLVQMPGLGGAPTTVSTFADVPLPAAVEQQKVRIGKATRAVTNVQLPPQEKAEQAERGKMLTQNYSDIAKQASVAAKTLPSIDANLGILNKGFETGFGTETKAAGAKVLAALGVDSAEKFATNAQVFQAKATEAVLQKQLEQKGPQTESDAQRIDAIGSQLGKTPQANKFLLTTAKEQLRRDMEQRNFYDNWWKNNKTYDGAESAWFAGEGGKSLFDRPALKQYLAPTATAAQIPTGAAPARAAPTSRPAPVAPNIDALLNKYK